jgi:hypothetical protein
LFITPVIVQLNLEFVNIWLGLAVPKHFENKLKPEIVPKLIFLLFFFIFDYILNVFDASCLYSSVHKIMCTYVIVTRSIHSLFLFDRV